MENIKQRVRRINTPDAVPQLTPREVNENKYKINANDKEIGYDNLSALHPQLTPREANKNRKEIGRPK